jgi:acetyl-CoA synthetase
MNAVAISFPTSLGNNTITQDQYATWYKESIEHPDIFWGTHGKRLDWITPYTRIKNVDISDGARIRWFEDGVLNACINCVDRRLIPFCNQVIAKCFAQTPRGLGALRKFFSTY